MCDHMVVRRRPQHKVSNSEVAEDLDSRPHKPRKLVIHLTENVKTVRVLKTPRQVQDTVDEDPP